MEQKLLEWMIFLWSRKYIFSCHRWQGTYILPSGCPEKAPGLLPYLLLSSFLSGHIKVHYKHKMSSNAKLSTLHNAICSGLLQCDWSSLFRRWRSWGKDAGEPRAGRRAGAQLLHMLWGAVPALGPFPHPLLSLCPQLLPITASTLQLCKNFPSEC